MGLRKKLKLNEAQVAELIGHGLEIAQVLHPGEINKSKRKQWVIDLVNDQVDIPILNEDQEGVVIGFVVDIVDALIDRVKAKRSS